MTRPSWNQLRALVYARAGGYCEYCHTHHKNSGQEMHVDHIMPSGGDDLDNLCLACSNCNSSKHKAMQASDPETGMKVTLFNPRRDQWSQHFAWESNATVVRGISPVGRATVARLRMNRGAMTEARAGNHPPKED